MGDFISGLGGALLSGLGNITSGLGNIFSGSIGNNNFGFNSNITTPQYGGMLKNGQYGYSTDTTAFQPGMIEIGTGDFGTGSTQTFAADTFDPKTLQSVKDSGLGGSNLMDLAKLGIAGLGVYDSLKTSKLKRNIAKTAYNDTAATRNAEEDRKAKLRHLARGTADADNPIERRTTYHTV